MKIAFLWLLLLQSINLVAESVMIEFKAGQYQISTANYNAILPPTGMLSSLKAKNSVFISTPWTLNNGKEFYVPFQNSCSQITQVASDTLVCEGAQTILNYKFGTNCLVLTVTAKDNPIKLFVNLSEQIEGILVKSVSEARSTDGYPVSSYSMKEASFLCKGQLMQISGFSVIRSKMLCLNLSAKTSGTVLFEFQTAKLTEQNSFAAHELYKDLLTILSPADYEVFQRETLKEGMVLISGKLKEKDLQLEYRFTGKNLDKDWHKVSLDNITGNFATQIKLPAGGWYSCEFKVLKGAAAVFSKTVDHFGVGEVFVAAGESNSTNWGEEPQKTRSNLVSTFSGKDWRLADDPQSGVHDASTMGSFYPAFGDALVERYKVPIGIASTGHGSTSISHWQPGGELFSWTLERILQLGPQGFRMVLWHHGESDGATSPEEYARRLSRIIEASNIKAGWSFPWMVARVTNTRGQEIIIKRGGAIEGPNTDQLRGDYRGRNGNDVHFSVKGLRKHGELWAEKVSAFIDSTNNEKAEAGK